MPREAIPQKYRQLGRELGGVFNDQRKDRELTVRGLSAESRVRLETVRSILAGRNAGPNIFLVANIAGALNMSLDDVIKEVLRRADARAEARAEGRSTPARRSRPRDPQNNTQ